MGKRQQGLLELLSLAPWWASLIAGLGAYAALKYYVPNHFQSPLFAPLAGALSANAHFLILPFLITLGMSLANRFKRRQLLDRQTDIGSLRELSWQQFELLVGEAFRRQGFSIEEVGGAGADGGVDLRLRKDDAVSLVQCKQWRSRLVGVSPVRELLGVMAAEKASQGFVVSSGSFTTDATAFAYSNGITLVDGGALVDMVRDVQQPAAIALKVPTFSTRQPTCPNCSGEMVKRVARRGAKAGAEFWGCATYPKCRGTAEI